MGWCNMSSENHFLALRLEGPLQSWGFDSQYNRRNTGLMPTKSGVAGICCAALGLPRGSHDEHEFLSMFCSTKMTAIAIPKNRGEKKDLSVRRLQDYHTVQNTRRAGGAINNDCVLTYRQYLTDAVFGVVIEGEQALLNQISTALIDPKWGVWLGRKSCIPSAPVFAGLKNKLNDALELLIGEKHLEEFTWQGEVENFSEGRDSLPDSPVSFATEKRTFAPRRVHIHHATNIG
ncbi:MAG: type I-E CRISPR-associated protein Cas5/CasD [Desulfobacterium sp.]|nr:type I-E CRISPR-associated protein Cas5/CasD [Desulfobacterium sp.]